MVRKANTALSSALTVALAIASTTTLTTPAWAQEFVTSSGIRTSITATGAEGPISVTRTTAGDPTPSTRTTTATATGATTSSVSVTLIPTATPSITAQADSVLPSQAALPPKQDWCPSDIFCAGEILQSINIARPYTDSKTIVDKPTNGTSQSVIDTFTSFGPNVTYGNITYLLQTKFQGEGLELAPNPLENFPAPASLSAFSQDKVPDPYVRRFALEVHKIWNLLIRDTNESKICHTGTCESSLIPLNHTFVVPGGRFREQYYWDSKFILEGLLVSELNDVAASTLQNFMDEIDQFGFIPNGGRIYYLNRSQPPVFITMVRSYVAKTNDVSILTRALPIMEKELTWWETNRAVQIKSPYTNQTRTVYHYAVVNSAPRPESYIEDYIAANGAGSGSGDDVDPSTYTDQQKSDLYAELASGAETGWDYSSRWAKNPHLGNATNQVPILRTMNIRNTTAVDLNAILYKARIDLAHLYDKSAAKFAKKVKARQESDQAAFHRQQAETLRTAILDLFWDQERLGFYDFNTTSGGRNEQLTAAHWYPLWAGIIPNEVQTNATKAFGAYSSLNLVMKKYNGTVPSTFVPTGLQWDFPNAWPPHIYFALEALESVPRNVSSNSIPASPSNNSWNLLPNNHLGLTQDKLPKQTLGGNNTWDEDTDLNSLGNGGTVANGGNATDGEGWADALTREIANRYVTSVFCSWYATGGSIPNLLPRLDNSTLNLTNSANDSGHLYEKFSALDVDNAGTGGEYAVQAGFGWTNGVLLWIVSKWGDKLVRPTCPNVTLEVSGNQDAAASAAFSVTLGGNGYGWMGVWVAVMVTLASGLFV